MARKLDFGSELLRAFREDLEERCAKVTREQKQATRKANAEYEKWRKGGKA